MTRELSSSRSRAVLLLAVSVLFTIGGVFMIGEGKLIGWAVVALFGFASVAGIKSLRQPGRLVISPEGITVHHFGKASSYDFARCSEFGVARARGHSMVTFEHPDFSSNRLAPLGRFLAGQAGSLPETYGMRAEHLAELLNQARRAHLSMG